VLRVIARVGFNDGDRAVGARMRGLFHRRFMGTSGDELQLEIQFLSLAAIVETRLSVGR
jgi:hypothetical protein